MKLNPDALVVTSFETAGYDALLATAGTQSPRVPHTADALLRLRPADLQLRMMRG